MALTHAERNARYYAAHPERAYASSKKWEQSDVGRDSRRRSNAKAFVKFKKGLTLRIECLQHTSPAFQPARVQEILSWAGQSHSYWVESEIQRVCPGAV